MPLALWCLLLEKSVSGTQKLLTQEFPCQVEESTTANASDGFHRLCWLNLLLCRFIPNLGVFLLASAPVSLAASGDLCPVLPPTEQPLTPWKKSSRYHRGRDDRGRDGTGAPGKGWRKLLNLETRRERRSLLDVFNFFAVEKQKGKR